MNSSGRMDSDLVFASDRVRMQKRLRFVQSLMQKYQDMKLDPPAHLLDYVEPLVPKRTWEVVMMQARRELLSLQGLQKETAK